MQDEYAQQTGFDSASLSFNDELKKEVCIIYNLFLIGIISCLIFAYGLWDELSYLGNINIIFFLSFIWNNFFCPFYLASKHATWYRLDSSGDIMSYSYMLREMILKFCNCIFGNLYINLKYGKIGHLLSSPTNYVT